MSYLLIDSTDRTSYSSSSSDFDIKLNESINVNKLKLVNVLIPNTIYNITSSNNNNLFIYTKSAVPTNHYIVNGSYSIDELISYINSDPTLSADFIASYNEITMKITLICTDPNTTLLSTSTCKTLFGFNDSISATASSITMLNCIALYNPLNLMINIRNLPANVKSSKSNNSSSTFIIPCSVSKGGIIVVDKLNDYDQDYELSGPLNISTLQIKLQYVNCNAISLNGCDWSMLIKYC